MEILILSAIMILFLQCCESNKIEDKRQTYYSTQKENIKQFFSIDTSLKSLNGLNIFLFNRSGDQFSRYGLLPLDTNSIEQSIYHKYKDIELLGLACYFGNTRNFLLKKNGQIQPFFFRDNLFKDSFYYHIQNDSLLYVESSFTEPFMWKYERSYFFISDKSLLCKSEMGVWGNTIKGMPIFEETFQKSKSGHLEKEVHLKNNVFEHISEGSIGKESFGYFKVITDSIVYKLPEYQ